MPPPQARGLFFGKPNVKPDRLPALFTYILKLNVRQKSRRSHWPTVRLPT